METIIVKTKPWGNSLGIILPKHLKLKPYEEIAVNVSRHTKNGTAEALWGAFKGAKLDTQKVLDELNEE
ncbi:hypothetical protein AUJ14_03125 [Candidatus Micrarchaeota archaeon CG1_02_55_22]|nr:MAG: hypothetical protein AUJ14_03125 [Candidatus Micrarchaeota archaeon CG1_02_55_22]